MSDSEAATATRRGPRHKPKAHFEKRAMAAMEKHLPKPEWSIRQKLAFAICAPPADDEGSIHAAV